MAKDTKERILTAALEMFSQKGYEGTNIRELSASLGLVKSGIGAKSRIGRFIGLFVVVSELDEQVVASADIAAKCLVIAFRQEAAAASAGEGVVDDHAAVVLFAKLHAPAVAVVIRAGASGVLTDGGIAHHTKRETGGIAYGNASKNGGSNEEF